MAGRITQALGGHVVSTSIGPAGLAAALWTQDSYPPWYHVVIWSGSLQAMTPLQVRIWATRAGRRLANWLLPPSMASGGALSR